jgi:altronate dehydratase
VHPNVGAVLIASYEDDPLTHAALRAYMVTHHYALDDVRHHCLTLTGDFGKDLECGAAIVQGWLAGVNATTRTPESLSHLKLALQCGGSDAFSGISGNPLAGALAKEIIRHGGAANLAETDELIGAEAYVLQNVRDEATARRFLEFVHQFREYLAWHGVTPEGNPSGGNRYRGLYNIALKSLGAAMKRDPQVRLDYAVDYAERMEAPGFYFMNTPGNDLESIAGQVAGGCNLIVFTTGNGSITNFPFVPTIKVVTTTARYQLLRHEMDVNAGAYLENTSLEALTHDAFELTTAIASGTRSVGERAGHSQISVWRNWRQTKRGPQSAPQPASPSAPSTDGHSLPIRQEEGLAKAWRFPAFRSGQSHTHDQIGLIVPTSLCAGQVARLSAAHLNQLGWGQRQISRFVALVHTEGCGVGGESAKALYTRTLLSYMTHPMVRCGLFLEHGCEITHNDYMRRQLQQMGRDPDEFGWASIQLDGGLTNVGQAIERWAEAALSALARPVRSNVGWEGLHLGLMAAGSLPQAVAESLAQVTRTIVGAGGTVVVPASASLTSSQAYLEGLGLAPSPLNSLAYGQSWRTSGFHLMEAPSTHWVETLTGLGATGVDLVLAYVDGLPQQGHPFIPVIEVSTARTGAASASTDFDLVFQPGGAASQWAEQLLELASAVAAHQYVPKSMALGNLDFQITRGLLGVTL